MFKIYGIGTKVKSFIGNRLYLQNLILAFALCFFMTSEIAAQVETVEVVHMNASEARQLLANRTDVQVLDVRTNSEFKRGHIEGAIRINYFSFKFKKKLRKLDRSRPYLVHCKSGHRSSGAVKVMKREGFTQIYHLDGGYDAWKAYKAPA